MSLKSFHLIFVTAASALAFGFGVWELNEYSGTHELKNLAMGLCSIVAGIALVIYERYFLRKLKNISYL